jgi:parallel beta-helix repeat protein
MKLQSLALIVLAIALCPALACAASCGDSVSGNVTLTNDLNCSGTGLTVVGDHTTINLNGFTISCTGIGFADSCQYQNGPVGILSTGFEDVSVVGPGTITGFHVGIRLLGPAKLNVDGVTVTGPAAPIFAANTRGLAVGVLIGQANCAASPGNSPSAVVSNNDISNHTQGVQLSSASCVKVMSNTIHDNNGTSDAHGIDVINSANNTIQSNTLYANGANHDLGNPDSGITLVGAGSSGNVVKNNTVLNNCGHGIVALNGADNNTIVANTVRFNATSLTPQCRPVPAVSPFFDLTSSNAGAGNTWNTNNKCQTQSAGIPAGVCNPGE